QFDEDDVRLLEVLAGHAAVAVENASLYESARREAESATALLEVGRELATAASLDEIFELIVRLTADLIGAPRTSIWIADEDGWLVPRTFFGLSDKERAAFEGRRFSAAAAQRELGAGLDPLVIGPEQYARFDDSPIDSAASYA